MYPNSLDDQFSLASIDKKVYCAVFQNYVYAPKRLWSFDVENLEWCDSQPLAESIMEVPDYKDQTGALMIPSSTNKHLLLVKSYRRTIRMMDLNNTQQAPSIVMIEDLGSDPKAFSQDPKRYIFSLGIEEFPNAIIFACQSVLV